MGTRRLKVAAYDFGMKWNILRRLAAYGCDVRVYPGVDAGRRPAGAGSPTASSSATARATRRRCRTWSRTSAPSWPATTPIFGICLGHQVLGLALGARTFKLKFGHRGANHPVKQLETGRVEITSQNHGFAVDPGVAARRRRW